MIDKKKIDASLRKLIFLDTETTGLDPLSNSLIELSYATIDSDIKTLYFGITEVSDFIDNLIKFTDRHIAGLKSSDDELNQFLELSNGNTMVCANPSFDKSFLEASNLFLFGYRMLDIESYAMARLDLSWVPGMDDIYKILIDKGYQLSMNDHSSAGDVACMRDSFIILRDNV